jgi:hypothetical protein
VEATIALSIVFLARELLSGEAGRSGVTRTYPWIVAFSFGLLHGLGFASALAKIALPQGEIPLALFAFNLGVELGQLTFIAAVLSVWRGALARPRGTSCDAYVGTAPGRLRGRHHGLVLDLRSPRRCPVTASRAVTKDAPYKGRRFFSHKATKLRMLDDYF